MYDYPVTPSKPRWKSKTHLLNLAFAALAAAELKWAFLQALLPVNVFLLGSFLLPVVNMILRENTDRAVGLDDFGVSRSNRIATVVLVLFAGAMAAALLFWPPAAKASTEPAPDSQTATCCAQKDKSIPAAAVTAAVLTVIATVVCMWKRFVLGHPCYTKAPVRTTPEDDHITPKKFERSPMATGA